MLTTWRVLLAKVRAEKPAVASTLELAAPLVVNADKIIVGFEPESFESARRVDTDATAVLADVARAHFGVPTMVSLEVAARGSRSASIASMDAAKHRQAVLEARAAVERHPMVQTAIAIFDAELRDIRLPVEE
jgi:hypothetical protein